MEGHLAHPLPADSSEHSAGFAGRVRLIARREFAAGPTLRRISLLLAIAGVATLVAGGLISPQRTWANLLVASNYALGMALGGLVFVALHYICGASWSTAFRRVPEAMAATLPWMALPFILILAVSPQLYPWFDQTYSTQQPSMWFKDLWLSPVFFAVRTLAYLMIWIVFSRLILRLSRQQDARGGREYTRRNSRLSAAFLVVFGFTFWLASYDWIMSLEPLWYSTIFGVYQFSGSLLGALALIVLLAIWLERRGLLIGVLNEEHLHDLGKLLFAISTFWMYIWFCQYMLIWYANLPEETSHFIRRLHGFWEPVFFLNLLLNWGVPFLVMLHVPAKRNRGLLVKVCGVILVGRWVDLYLMIMPPVVGEAPVFGIWEVGAMAGAAGLFSLVLFRVLRSAPLVPLGDPTLEESLTYHN